ncbi:hypothetical protein [uncultured Bacteroides sp.]|uniref:hypothetical protein n=1 Tax=uncultured Bacteroides sp. TaxID=162156 RepID=UPI002AA69B5C|nr:hypothetical protein [uncultured Bacteroides sp.]
MNAKFTIRPNRLVNSNTSFEDSFPTQTLSKGIPVIWVEAKELQRIYLYHFKLTVDKTIANTKPFNRNFIRYTFLLGNNSTSNNSLLASV